MGPIARMTRAGAFSWFYFDQHERTGNYLALASAILYMTEGINASVLINCNYIEAEWQLMWSDLTLWLYPKATTPSENTATASLST